MSSGIYYADILDVLVSAGCKVAESSVTNGWQTRARSSGGFATAPLAVVWHHTASSASPANDLSYMINGSPDAPIGNLLLDRTGTFWPIAAGCANTQGKGGPVTMSRGTIPLDSGNSHAWAIEAANSGVGEVWPVEQIGAYFAGSNALSAHFGNLPTDVITHSLADGGGWTDRKIDPAIADMVEGYWLPAPVNSSGTWSLVDIRAECERRAGSRPPDPEPEPTPIPQPPDDIDEDYDMAFIIINKATGQPALVYGDGKVTGIDGLSLEAFTAKYGPAVTVEDVTFNDFADKE